MDENVQHDLALACVRLAQQITQADEVREKTGPSRTSKARKEALQALLSAGNQHPLSFDHLTEVLWQLYESSSAQSNTRQRVIQMLFDLAKRRDLPVKDAREAAHTLYRMAPKGSEEKQQAIRMLLDLAKRRDIPFGKAVGAAHTLYRMAPKGSEEKQRAIQMLLAQAQWPGVTIKQSVEAILALCYASPVRSKERQQGIQILLDLAQRPDLSVEDALVLITLDRDIDPDMDSHIMMLLASTPAWEKRQWANWKQILDALAQRSDLTSRQAVQIAEWRSVLSRCAKASCGLSH